MALRHTTSLLGTTSKQKVFPIVRAGSFTSPPQHSAAPQSSYGLGPREGFVAEQSVTDFGLSQQFPSVGGAGSISEADFSTILQHLDNRRQEHLQNCVQILRSLSNSFSYCRYNTAPSALPAYNPNDSRVSLSRGINLPHVAIPQPKVHPSRVKTAGAVYRKSSSNPTRNKSGRKDSGTMMGSNASKREWDEWEASSRLSARGSVSDASLGSQTGAFWVVNNQCETVFLLLSQIYRDISDYIIWSGKPCLCV